MPDRITAKNIKLFLASLLLMLVLITALSYWTQDCDTQQAIPRTLSPNPQNEMLVIESIMCSSANIPIKPPPHNNIRCPQKTIVTVKQSCRLGNQMYEYTSVWSISKIKRPEAYIPSCLFRELGEIT